jgi:hypothetical protein
MSRCHTPEEAKKNLTCPLARTFSKKVGPNCMGGNCAAWRWLPLDAKDPRFTGAISREMACLAQDEATETGKKAKPAQNYHKQAVANVRKDPEAYDVPSQPEKGWCGLGGQPS